MQKPLGQEKIVDLFLKLASQKRVGHAYVLEGAEGSGKKTTANYIARILLCRDENGCDECTSCKCADAGTHPDIIRLSNEDKKTIGIDKVRDMTEKVYERPTMGKRKIIIIENAHLLTVQAQNALLKVIEEPPAYIVFFLLCNTVSRLLPTILSRVTRLGIAPLGINELKMLVPDAPQFMYKYCQGTGGRLIALSSDTHFSELRDATFASVSLLTEKDQYSLFDYIAGFKKDRQELIAQTDVLVSFFKDCMLKSAGVDKSIVNMDKTTEIDNFVAFLKKNSAIKCARLSDAVFQAQRELASNCSIAPCIHTMAMNLFRIIHS